MQALAIAGPSSIHTSHGVSSFESTLENGMRNTKISEVNLTLQLPTLAIERRISVAEYRQCAGKRADVWEFSAASVGPQRPFSAFVSHDPAGQIYGDIPFSVG